ncbi:MAG: SPRY domain-containing protein [Pseudomonadota bacterium]
MSTAGPAFFSVVAGGLPTVTLNPSDKASTITLSSGNLVATKGSPDAYGSVRATRSINAATENGYFEMFVSVAAHPSYLIVGVAPSGLSLTSFPGATSTSWGYYQDTGQKYNNNTPATYGATFTTNDVIGVAVKNGKIWFAKNNTWQASGNPAAGTGEAFSGLTGSVFPCFALFRFSPADRIGARFSTAAFTYSPPSGFDPWGG